MWNFGVIQTLMNWASKSLAMAFALSAVEEIELKTQAAFVDHELLWILSVVRSSSIVSSRARVNLF